MIKLAYLIPAAALLAASAPSKAEPPNFLTTGTGLLEGCHASSTTPDGQIKYLACTAYVYGVYNGFQWQDKTVCPPQSSDTKQLVEAGLNFIRQNPEIADGPSSKLLILAWQLAFPCPKNP